ncbi:MAG: fumarylacetoacetase [Armatimonadota bacterium]|nr:fumarylacetoacetase [Armatimonadota bacterium]
MQSWIEVAEHSDFPIQNLPYGAFSTRGEGPRVGVRIGEFVLDLAEIHSAGLLPGGAVYGVPFINDLMALGPAAWHEIRSALTDLLREGESTLRDDVDLRQAALIPMADVTMHLPVKIGAFVDFYSSEQHATNVGSMFRPDAPLMPNWKHLPVGYNGRASSVVVSGTPIKRPMGQTAPGDSTEPILGPSRNLDFELEVGFFTGSENPLGSQVPTGKAGDFIFGLVLVNDWSARDIQRWEYQPLGPFLSKSFGTTISPWVVPMAALDAFRISGPDQNPPVLDYLKYERPWRLDMNLAVHLRTEKMTESQVICRTNFRNMYWNMAQQLAHQTVNGTNVQIGDLYASGTVSGDEPDSFGSMLELAWRGERPITMEETGEERKFLQDGDTVILTGSCQGEGYRVGFGEAAGKILPS